MFFLRNVLESWCVLPFFAQGLVFCGRAPEPRAREVNQSLGRLLSFDPHAPFFRKREEGWGTSYYPRLGEFQRSPVSY
jgi:hypothetical protein